MVVGGRGGEREEHIKKHKKRHYIGNLSQVSLENMKDIIIKSILLLYERETILDI
jgi:hypothetical protein